MPQFTSFTLADGQATPVTHTFSVVSLKDGLAQWADRSASTFALQPKVTAKVASSTKATGVNRVTLATAVPYTDAVNGARAARFNPEFLIPNDAPLQVRKDILAYARNLLASPMIEAMVVNGEAVH